MPRTKLPRGQPHFISRGHPLSDTAKAKLLDELLGADDAPLIIGEIEAALGICVDGAEHIDNPPRPADYVRAFNSLKSKSQGLSEELFSINYYYDEQLSNHGVDPNNIAVELLKLAEVSKAIVQEFVGKSSKGARKNTALLESIRRLKRIFRYSYRGPVTERQKRGAFMRLSEWESRQQRFIRTALTDARCIRQSCTDRELQRLIHDPRCALPQERNRVIERLARRAGKSSLPYTFPEPDESRHARARRQKGNAR
jgi:hypothetical protein